MTLDRREFVKGCVAAGCAGAVGLSGFAAVRTGVPAVGGVGVEVAYPGAVRVAGPAPRPLAILPVEVDAEGFLRGRLTFGGDQNVLNWFKYCGHEKAPGLSRGFRSDNRLRYRVTEEQRIGALSAWYSGRDGQPMRPEDFREVGTGAAGVWRSEGVDGKDLLTLLVIRVGNDPARLDLSGLPTEWAEEVAAQVRDVGVLAFTGFCTHFCCVPGYHESEEARVKGRWDDLYCTCHGSTFEPHALARGRYLLEEGLLE